MKKICVRILSPNDTSVEYEHNLIPVVVHQHHIVRIFIFKPILKLSVWLVHPGRI